MPTINKKKIKTKPTPYPREGVNYAKYYNSCLWKHLRNSWIREHPVCEICYQQGIIKNAEHVHHIRPWSKGIDDEERWSLLLDEDNIVSLCEAHHKAVHNGDIKIDSGGGSDQE